jgi:ribulose bisphosphate carboxylase small subunit
MENYGFKTKYWKFSYKNIENVMKELQLCLKDELNSQKRIVTMSFFRLEVDLPTGP